MSQPDDEELREAFATSGGPSQDPVDAQTLWDVVQGQADPEERDETLDRLGREADVLEEWQIARAFCEATETADTSAPASLDAVAGASETPPAAPAANQGAYRVWLAVAAVAATVLLAALLWPRRSIDDDAPPSREIRSETGAAIESAIDGPLARDAAVLSWTPVEGASSYDVVVTSEDLEPLFDATGLDEPTVTIDAARLQSLAAGDRLLFRVEAVMPDGSRRRSGTLSAELR